MDTKERFPLFLSSQGKKVVVIGGGKIATRRIATLVKFGFYVKCVAPFISEEIKEMAVENTLILKTTKYDKELIKGSYFVLACTDDKKVNEEVWEDCKNLNILVNRCDDKEACDFYFPAIAVNESATVAIVGDGEDHEEVKKIAIAVREVIERKAY